MLGARVAERQLTPATATADEAGQQGVAVLRRAMMTAGGDVAADHGADRLGLLPADIALMGIGHQRQPVSPRLAPDPCANASRAMAHAAHGLTIGIGATVNGVLDHTMDRGVVRTPPHDVAAVPPHRQLKVMLQEPEQCLPRTAELQHLVEHQRDRCLDPAVRVLLVAVARFDEAHGCADDELAAACLLVAGRKRALA